MALSAWHETCERQAAHGDKWWTEHLNVIYVIRKGKSRSVQKEEFQYICKQEEKKNSRRVQRKVSSSGARELILSPPNHSDNLDNL